MLAKLLDILVVDLFTIRYRINDLKKPNWNYENNDKRVATNLTRAVVVDNKYYISVSMAAAK